MNRRPRIALTVGDPAGIGPEIVHAALAEPSVRGAMDVIGIGPARLAPPGLRVALAAEDALDLRASDEGAVWLATHADDREESWELGRPQASAGRAALAALRAGAELAHRGEVDALVTAPVSKEALHLAGERCEGQTQLLGRWAGVEAEMLAIAGNLRVLLLTRHMPLRAALDCLRADAVTEHLVLLDRGLVALGFVRPRIACAGLNPHAGEAGILGSEEREILEPAIAAARERGVDVSGPESPDTVFQRASVGAFDGVLALYHDQAFLPVKFAEPRGGLTVLLRLPYLRVSPAHGTAFDIVGTGRADPSNLILALERAAQWGPGFRAVSTGPAR
ncbi:MAG TPA: 4-hydroxythreonine-4-phosphate dehydrogenase PdxA [Planctomycetes bacterium]|nr:4-hydroxythreonine-4-phosphate dehydrogenase PdxA [Planctomycetota bacterium]